MKSPCPPSITVAKNHEELMRPEGIKWLREQLDAGQVVIAKNAFEPGKLRRWRDYLTQIGRSSIPNYQAIRFGCPNFHRINVADPRAYVGGVFHQFSFFPWNQDVFQSFKMFEGIFRLKNLVSHIDENSYLAPGATDECTVRLSFQFYPQGGGSMNVHTDPVDKHQATVPIMLLSEKPRDYSVGGLMVTTRDGEICVDDYAGFGDMIYFAPGLPHGVAKIDPDCEMNWTEFAGRWMLLFATNKMTEGSSIANANDLTAASARK